MARGCKRKREDHIEAPTAGRPTHTPSAASPPVKRDLLHQCYPCVLTLRQYLLAKLPSSSRLRRKKIASLGSGKTPKENELDLSKLLDTTLVGTAGPVEDKIVTKDLRWEQWLSFSQKDESYVSISDSRSAIFSQSDIVDFVIWLLFSRKPKAHTRPKHLLCGSFRKKASELDAGCASIPGLFSLFSDSRVETLRRGPWPQVLALLGQAGERVMIDLLLDCSIFVAIQAGLGNYYQLSGLPISETDLSALSGNASGKKTAICRSPSDITFVRSRVFYAKAAQSSRGLVQTGLRQIHILSRCSRKERCDPCPRVDAKLAQDDAVDRELQDEMCTTKLMMYIFPRQFGLHNVFTSPVDRQQTAQRFQDYTVRDGEIAALLQALPSDRRLPKLPKRLRGHARHIVQRLQVRHDRCSYAEMLKHYCPTYLDSRIGKNAVVRRKVPTSTGRAGHTAASRTSQSQGPRRGKRVAHKPSVQPHTEIPQVRSLDELACPVPHVSAFCQAVLSKLIPDDFWGQEGILTHNKKTVLQKVDHFIKLRRFETMTLHELAQGLKISDIAWLQQPSSKGHKPSKTDTNKRTELFHEVLYFVFDSILIPLLRTNFYVTETNTHRYQIFYFRQDVWKSIADPAMAALKSRMFEDVSSTEATRILASRQMGFSQIRLLPKKDDIRPIMNLRRRAPAKDRAGILGPSVNTVLSPVHTILKLEKALYPEKLASTMFSVGDIYTRLKEFKVKVAQSLGKQKLYFAKVDVLAAFDTIPQAAIVKLMSAVPSRKSYTIAKHAEMNPGERAVVNPGAQVMKPARRWLATALDHVDSTKFASRLEKEMAVRKKHTVFVESAARKMHHTGDLVGLLTEHIERNVVKVGKRYYRQKKGIPQGSILSAFLCNYFYADLELRNLQFLRGEDTLLLRLIDDFLLITLDKAKAERFVRDMHQGFPEYGVEVSHKKTLVNFDMELPEGPVPRIPEEGKFPYCGTMIDCQLLEITKDRERHSDLPVSNTLTVDFSRLPGQNFQRKVLNSFKIQSHLMFFDTALNSTDTVLETLRGAFCETSKKMWAYIRCMPKTAQPDDGLIMRTIRKVINVAFLLLTGESRKLRHAGYSCNIRKSQASLVGFQAFVEVLRRKQTKYQKVVAWLDGEISRLNVHQ